MEYVVRRRLSTGFVPGDVVTEDDFRDGITEILVERKAIEPIEPIEEAEEDSDGTDDWSAT